MVFFFDSGAGFCFETKSRNLIMKIIEVILLDSLFLLKTHFSCFY